MTFDPVYMFGVLMIGPLVYLAGMTVLWVLLKTYEAFR